MPLRDPKSPITYAEFQRIQKDLIELTNKFNNLTKQHNIVVRDLNITKTNLIKAERALKQKIMNVEHKIPKR